MTTDALDPASIDKLARTMWGEARGGGLGPMEDVGMVVLRRAKIGGWWGSTVVGVCLAPWQFSSWNANDPNRAKLMVVTVADPCFALAMQAARNVLSGTATDRTGCADSYFATGIPTPAWALDPHSHHTATVWRHTFWQTRTPSASRPNLNAHAVMSPAEMAAAAAINAAWLAKGQAIAQGHV